MLMIKLVYLNDVSQMLDVVSLCCNDFVDYIPPRLVSAQQVFAVVVHNCSGVHRPLLDVFK